jgi:hypothetical protein
VNISCGLGCKILRKKRIAVLDHCFTEKHPVVIKTKNRGRLSVIRGEIQTHEQARGDDR